jgi:hypothetical protein
MLAEAGAGLDDDAQRRVRALCLLGRAALAIHRGGAAREVLAGAPIDLRYPEGRLLRAAVGDAVPLPGVRALLSRLGLVAGMRHRVLGRAGTRVVTDDELAALRLAHAVVIEPSRAVITARVGGVTRLDRGRPLACELFAVLVEAHGAVISAEQLFLSVWGAREYHPLRHRNTLYVAVKRLRSTLRTLLDDDRELIETAAGGWRVIDALDAIVVRPEGGEG